MKILQAIKHTLLGVGNIPKILFGTGRLVDKDMKKKIVSGENTYPKTVDVDLCLGCGVCSRICPMKCITMTPLPEKVELRPGQYKDKYPDLNSGSCCFCYQCHDNCPTYTVHKVDAAINPRGVRDTRLKAHDLFSSQKQEQKPQDDIVTVDSDLCLGCGVCSKVCPTNAITMEDLPEKIQLRPGQFKDKVPKIDLSKCVKCMMCFSSCITKKAYGKPSSINPEGLTPSGIKASDLFKQQGNGGGSQ
ncbi:MAG: 4Fe-4S binding protein [Candidatus Altiarchaeota archaeon]|nr:4Fe-4S binding protein [Candidatus Altiarchaeota archaeon]